MTSTNSTRLLVPANQIIVVLDTAPARELAYETETPGWVSTFAEMSKEGYSFSLADGAISELLAQRCRGGLSATDVKRMLDRIQLFLNLDVPMMPGKKDLSGMLRVSIEPWDEGECRALSALGFRLLKQCADPEDVQPSPEWALQEEREDWVAFFNGWQKILDDINSEDPSDPVDVKELTDPLLKMLENSQDTNEMWTSLNPSMSKRSHLQNRYYWRQFMRMQLGKMAYNPSSPKKRNDGIDSDLFNYLILPALIITRDRAFFEGLSDIKSFQTRWFFKPEELARSWLQGEKPAPLWPK